MENILIVLSIAGVGSSIFIMFMFFYFLFTGKEFTFKKEIKEDIVSCYICKRLRTVYSYQPQPGEVFYCQECKPNYTK